MEVLFDKMQIDPKAKKTKTGQYATGEDVLLKLAGKNKIVEDIPAFREFTKLEIYLCGCAAADDQSQNRQVHTSMRRLLP